MQIGIRGAAGDTWGGAPIHPASQKTGGIATDGDHDGWANVYDSADAIPAAASYLKANGAPGDIPGALFAYCADVLVMPTWGGKPWWLLGWVAGEVGKTPGRGGCRRPGCGPAGPQWRGWCW